MYNDLNESYCQSLHNKITVKSKKLNMCIYAEDTHASQAMQYPSD